jgi:DEAD/DEAH box helicase domain-containing protein
VNARPETADLPWASVIDEGWRVALDPGRNDGRLVAESAERESEAIEVPLPETLDPGLRASLQAAGIGSLYAHQLAAMRAADGGNVIVTSGTASGKSLAFNLPVLERIAADPKARALYLYPTKALAQDQARKLAELAPPGLRPAIYDGDTPKEERPAIRRRSNLVLTNPDMLHVGLLPNHRSWGDFLVNLTHVVVDEAHVYRGVFGSNVANVLRRLRRICRIYAGEEPRFLLASATIANPGELAERLVGTPFEVVDDDGAPKAGRRIAIWNPPLLDEVAGARRSALSEAAEMLAELVAAGVRTICFLRSRRGIELIQKFTAMRLAERGREDLAARIAPYRAGYTPQQRREIEARLAAGELLAVVATDALELGIDIGELDAALCVTFPGTVASLRQMWGRAGRRSEGLAIYMAGEDGLDQFFCRHPGEFLSRPVEAAILDHANEQIQSTHLLAAAYESPLGGPHDEQTLGAGWRGRADGLVERGLMRKGGGNGYRVRGPGFPAGWIGLRSASADSVGVVDADSGELLGTVEAERAFSTVHPGAVYLHMGRAYEVSELDVEMRRAVVRPFGDEWYTQPRKETDTWIEQLAERREVLGVELSFGRVAVSEQVIGFQRKRLGDHEAIDFVALDLPEQSFHTQALWYVLPDGLAGPAALPGDVLLGALHASEHSQIAVLPLLAMCDRWDIGGLSTNVHPQTGRPTIFIYDGHPGGVGITRRGFEQFERLVGDAHRLVSECPCESGCPSCVQSPKCGNLNEHLHKGAAIELMGGMLGARPASRAGRH